MKEQNDHRNIGLELCSNDKKSADNNNVLKESTARQSKSNTNNVTSCELHDNVLLYCCDCSSVVCGQCEKIHASHQKIKLVEASKTNKAKMNKEVLQVKNLIRYANVVLKDLNAYLEKLDVHLAEITAEVLERAMGLPEGFESLSDSLINDIREEHDVESNRIKNKITEFDQFISSAKSLVINCENVVNSVDDTYVTVKGNSVLKTAQNLVSSLPVMPVERCIYVLSPLPNASEGKTLTPKEIIGDFTRVLVPWRIEVKRTGSFKPDSVSARFVTTMCPAHDELVWVVWQWGPQIHLVDKNGEVKKTINANCKVDDICTHNDTLVISSHEAKCIKILDKNCEIIKTIDMQDVPRGVYFSSTNEIITCCVQNLHHKNGDVSSIVKTNVDSGDQTELPCREHLIQPWRVAVNLNGDICVSDRNKGCVMIFDQEGHLKSTYSGPDTSTRHPFAPHAIICDRFGQIFAVDYTNHTVHVLDPLGRFRGFLIMDTELEKRAIFMGTSSPFSITIDTAGDVWVGNKFGYLTVLKYYV